MVTQEMTGKLLGVRRERVTQVVGQFEKDHLIERARGRITVPDRTKLEKRV
jgi:DNA-binding MarR family transcriptional regulator